MADAGTKATDDIIEELEKQLHKEYSRAAKETTAKLDDYLRRFQIKDGIKRKALQEGKITREYYQYWRTGQILIGERWKEMANTLATDLANVDAIARSTVKGYMMDVYALNHGYATFEIERETLLDTSYTLYNRDTVQNLWKNNPKLLPDPVPGSPTAKMLEQHEDMRWNRDNLQAELVQGILQGESIPQLAARMQNVTDMDERSAVRNARTMCTGAMNKGRLDGYQRAKDMGIEVKKVWSATHDGRTRKTHSAQDGEAVELNKEFPNGCMFPGDPDADPSETYNCRCSMNCESQRSKHSYYMQDLWASMRKGEDIVPYREWVEKKERQAKIIGYEGQKSLLEKITAIKADAEKNGYTMERYKQAGAEIRKEYEAEAARLKAQYGEGYDKLKEQYKELQQAEDKAYDALTQARREGKSPEKIQELKGQWSDILDQRVQTGNKVVEIEANMLLKEEKAADWLAGKLGEVREVGTKDLDMARHFINKRSPVKKDIQYAYEHYPTDWVKDSLQQGALYCGKVGRGYYDGYGIYISGFSEKDFRETAFHELGHRYEDVVSGIKSIETTFFNLRKGDETPTWLGSGYRYDEVAVKDNFIDHYMGKRYSDNSYELVSMGFQYAYWNPERLAQDQEFQELIYGILAIR